MSETSSAYTRPARWLHWISALLLVIVAVLGLLHDSWPRETQSFWINLHAVLGLALWLTVMARVAWRVRHHPPPLPPGTGAFAQRSATPVHLAMYGLLLVIPIVGIVTFVWHGRVFDFALFKVDFGVAKNRAIFHPTEDLHGYLAYALFALVGLHLLAVGWHQWVRKDGILRRMWP
jgi:cytochrome b561